MPDKPGQAALDACEQEPLAFSGLVQDVGALLVTAAGEPGITHLSANTARWFDLPDSLENLSLQSLFVDDCDYFAYRRRDIFEGGHHLVANVISNRGVEGDLLLSEHEGRRLHEFEAKTAQADSADATTDPQVTVSEGALPETIDAGAILRRIHSLTGYAKIMLYRFLEDGSGEVIAELSDQKLDPYLGLRFPATDIPRIARNLYINNPFRLIFDTRVATAEVLPTDAGGGVVDLSTSTLRSVSPVHLEYLHNMGVRSSASFPVRVMGKLWGLVALHNNSPRGISIERRVAVRQLVEHELSRQLMDARIRAEHRRFNANAERLQRSSRALLRALRDGNAENMPDDLDQLIDAEALLVVLDGQLVHGAATVSTAELQALRDVGRLQALRGQFSTSAIGGFVEQDADFRRRVSGLLYATTAGTSAGRLELLWLRREQAATVQWAGEPGKVEQKVDGETRISPRQSFATWSARAEGQALPWSSSDLLIASKLLVQVLSGASRNR